MQRVFNGEELWTIDQEPGMTPKQVREYLYANYADPLFFKYNRGEATKYEWLQMVKKIKDTYPDE